MSEKNLVLDVLEELSQKRLLSSEVETMTSPFKGKISSLNFRFQSAAKSFGSQKDIVYNEGYSLTCTAGNSEVEVILLFSKEDNDLAESFKGGHVFEENVKFIDYDTLYGKPIFGKVDLESPISVDEKEIPSSSEIISSSIEEKPIIINSELKNESEVDQGENEIESLFSVPQADAELSAGEKPGPESDSSLTAEEEEIIKSIEQWRWRKKKRGEVVMNGGLVLLLFTFFSVVQPIAPGLWVIFGVPGLALAIIGGVIILTAVNGLPPGMTPPPGYTARTSSYYGGGCNSCGSGGDEGCGGGDGGCGGGD
ncbi:hypothetical protein OAG32_04660 [Akkermansiaceae bacterium]|nr:hypothetical protein [Akkermansiaceae bacterium]